ncbi:hypothetical protein AVEN_149469-1, partial [Araneus ventricosus]
MQEHGPGDEHGP